MLVVAAPLATALVWGRWVAPKARHPTVDAARLGLEVLVFGSAVAALVDTDEPVQAAVLGAAAAVHLMLTFPLGQRRAGTAARGR